MPVSNDQAALDAEFTLDTVPDLDAVFARRAAATADADARLKATRAIPYGPGRNETLNLFHPASATGPAPVQIFIHGGFWSSLSADDFSFVAAGFVPFGAAVAVIDYPLIPEVRLGDIVLSCMRALAFIHTHGGEHGLNPERIFVSGNSAGAHLVSEILDRPRLIESNLPADAVKGGTAISGLYDLAPVAASFRNETLGLTEEEVATFSPLRRTPDIAAPLIVAVGGDETREFLDQSAHFAEQARHGGAPVDEFVVPDTNHITVVLDAFANPDAPLNHAVRRQMGLD